MRLNYPDILPITSHRAEIVKAIEENQVVVVVGETGSGKSTQIPKMILEALSNLQNTDPEFTLFKIACTQPRRIAAVSIASWIAHEMEVEPGQQVGYKIRFDDDTTSGTIITVCTDGILLQEMKGDGLLSRYDAILVDEAHERNLNIDFLLGLLNDIQPKRRAAGLHELKILVTSATFDAGKFADFFAGLNVDSAGERKPIPIINVSGRLYPVDIAYDAVQSNEDLYKKIALLIKKLSETGEQGDALVFLPGEAEIFRVIREIEMLGKASIKCLPLYSRLSMDEQEAVYNDYPGKMKVVVATNIAETSLTVPGIKYVVDCGLARMTDFNFRTGIGSLEVRPISQASAIQRAGRAGRVQAGTCYRLFTEKDFETREKYTKPEIQRSDLSSVVLHMLLIGIKDLTGFHFIDAPEPKAFRNAIANLIELGAIDENQNLTELGVKMAHLPLEPRISAMLLAAEKYNCVNEVAIIASSLSVKDPFLRPNEEEEEADYAKRAFQRMALNGGPRYRTMRIRRGRKLITKRVMDKSFADNEMVSDLMVFLVVWNRVQSIPGEEEREYFCQSNYLNYLILKEIGQIYRQLLDTLNIFAKDEFSKYLLAEGQVDLSVELSKKEGILKSISSGFIQNLCEAAGHQTYRMRSTENIFIHPGSALFTFNPRYFVSAEIVETTRLFARNNTVIDPRWLEEIAPQLCKYRRGPVFFDRKLGKAVWEEEVTFRGTRIVKDRLVEVAKNDRELALDYLIREGLVKKQLSGRYDWIGENDRMINKLKVYAAKLSREQWVITPAILRDWYWNKISSSGKTVTGMADLDRLLKEKGQDYLKIKIEEFVSERDREKIAKLFPEEVYLAGRKFKVEYHFDDYRFPSGPVIVLSLDDLQDLDDQLVSSNLKQYDGLAPYFVVNSGPATAVIAEGKSLEEIKQEADRWHLKKNLKKLRREEEVRGIRFDEIWHFVPGLLDEIEVGNSLFGNSAESMVYVYAGLRTEGRKIVRTVFEDREMAWKSTLDVFKALFLWKAKYEFFFREKLILEMEKKFEKYLYGIDLTQVLQEALWKKLDFEGRFAQMEKIRDLEFVKRIFDEQKDLLESHKKKVLASLEKTMLKMEKLASSEQTEDLQELAAIKMRLQKGDF
jgi:ATP-dependent helicase HrpA